MPKKTTRSIINSGNHYLIQVKKNQPKLYQALKNMVQTHSANSSHQQQDNLRGRQEFRKVEVYSKPEDLPQGWTGIARVLSVQRTRLNQGKRTHSQSYYITSLSSDDAMLLAQGVRGHWSIENQLHWVKDVRMLEDTSGIQRNNGIENLSILKNIAINLVREIRGKSIKKAAIYYAANVNELCQYFRT